VSPPRLDWVQPVAVPTPADVLGELKDRNVALQRRINELTRDRDRAEATVRQQGVELDRARREIERLRGLVDRVPEYRDAPDARSPLTAGARQWA